MLSGAVKGTEHNVPSAPSERMSDSDDCAGLETMNNSLVRFRGRYTREMSW